MIRIYLVHYPRALPSSISFPMDILRGAASAYALKNSQAEQVNIELIHCPMPLKKLHKQALFGALHLDEIDHTQKIDLIILPAIWRNPRPLIRHAQPLIAWLQNQYDLGADICAVGTASCFLAEAGLLDNKPATTHWFYFDTFEKNYPKVKLQRKHLITQSGQIFCAGSINAIADLSIYFSEYFFGKAIAQQIESHFSPEIRRPIDQQLYRDDQFTNSSDERISLLQYWLREHYNEAINLAQMAEQADMSERHLSRLFKRETSNTPLQFLQKHRIDVSKTLLRDTNLNVSDIATQIGFEDSSYFIRLFKRQTQVTPKQFRNRIRNKLFN